MGHWASLNSTLELIDKIAIGPGMDWTGLQGSNIGKRQDGSRVAEVLNDNQFSSFVTNNKIIKKLFFYYFEIKNHY